MKWLNPLSSVIDGVSNYFTNKQNIKAKEQERQDELKQAQHDAKVERIKRGDETERDYDIMAMENAKESYIDEIMIFWVLAIVTCLFIPPLAPYAIAGFQQLATVPVWFQTILVGSFIAKLGLRFLFSGRTLFGKKLK